MVTKVRKLTHGKEPGFRPARRQPIADDVDVQSDCQRGGMGLRGLGGGAGC